jgi:uncharacterized protein (DUF1330 family)
MLNLLRFKDRADGIDAGEDISGIDAYRRYGEAVRSNLARVGGSLILLAECKESVIGPEDEHWDLLALAQYPSRAAFLEMIGTPDFVAKHSHRAAALEDSRLICCERSEG